MALPDEANKNTLPTPASRLEPGNIGAQIKALERLLQKPAFTSKQPVSENKELQLTVEVNSLTAENHRLTEDMEKVKKDLAKYRALVIRTQEESRAVIADMERSLKQLQIENGNLKSRLKGAKVLLKIPILKSKIVFMK